MTPWAIPRATRGGEGLLLSESGLSSWTGVWHGRGSSLCTPRWGLSARPRLCWVPRAAVTWSASEEGASATFLYRTFSEFLDCKEEEVSTLRARLPGVVAVPFLFSKAAKQPCISCCKQTTRDLVCFGHESALWAKLEWNSSFCSPWYRPRWLRLRQPRNAPPPAVSVVPRAPVRDGLAGLAPRCRCRPGVCPTGCGTERSARPLLSDTGADPRPSDLIWAARNRSRCCVIEILRRKGAGPSERVLWTPPDPGG